DAFLRKVKTGMIKPDENGKINAKGQ
ncbi:type II toxin-antitoxin system ParD family antitoxin, partial [Salmonella enterica]|nr:type II toxin-antitoxin system ParD family antitoxin [Salmonella enterica]EJS7667441.1 type II toxin-antitoxin system ParD family antitoxin [Salmonella enterica]